MKEALRFVHGMPRFGGTYRSSWSGYYFKEKLGYTTGVHTGVDYNGAGGGNTDKGYDAVSIANGIVRLVGNFTNKGYGNTVIIEHVLSPKLATKYGCSSLYSRYMHLDRIDVSVGQEVNVGQRIGLVGNTGTQYAHLHVDVWKSTIGGEKVHLRYDKNTQLASYLDAFELAEAHKNEREDNNMPSLVKDNIGPARIGYSEVLGRDFGKAHRGDFDKEILQFYGNTAYPDFYQILWTSQEAQNYRNKLGQNASLASQIPQKDAQINSLNNTLTEKAKEVGELTKQLETCKTSGGGIDEDTKAKISENNAILKFLRDAWNSVFKPK